MFAKSTSAIPVARHGDHRKVIGSHSFLRSSFYFPHHTSLHIYIENIIEMSHERFFFSKYSTFKCHMLVQLRSEYFRTSIFRLTFSKYPFIFSNSITFTSSFPSYSVVSLLEMSSLSPQRHALVIGGTGFISQYAVEELATAGYTVSIVTRGSTPDLHGELVASRLKINCNKRKEFVTSLRNSLQTIAQDQHLTSVPNAWDLVVDFICFDGDHASDIVEGLSGICKIFVQISTDSIYEVCKRPTDNCYGTCYGRTEKWAELLDIPESKLLEKDDYG